MGKDKKDKKKKPTEVIDTTKFSAKTGLIDRTSIQEYKSLYAQYQARNGAEANSKLEEHVQTRLRNTAEEQKKKRKRDMTSVAASTAASTAVPFAGIPIMVATTMVQCVGFSASLGLIPVANIRSLQDASTLASQMTSTLQKASSSGLKAAIEAFVIEVLKNAGIGYWLWDEILKDIIFQMITGVAIDSTWVLTPLFMAPKYYLHRKLIKKMYVALGEKAIVVHKAWVRDHLFLGKPETDPAAVMVPSADPNGYPTTGQTMYESNSDEGVPYPVYYQPAFAASTHRPAEANPGHGATPNSNLFSHLPEHPHYQYAYYPPSYPMHAPNGQAYPSAGPQHQPFYSQQYPSQLGVYAPSSHASGYNPSIYHANSLPSPRSQAPSAGYPLPHQTGGKQGETVTGYPQSYHGAYTRDSYPSAPTYQEQIPTRESSQQEHQQPSHYNPSPYPSAPAYPHQASTSGLSHYQHLEPQESHYNANSYPSAPTYPQHAPTSGASYYQHLQSQPPSLPSEYPAGAEQKPHLKTSYGPPPDHYQQSSTVNAASLPSEYPAGAEQKPPLKTSYGPPPDHYQQSSSVNAAAETYPQKAPPQKQPEAC